MPQHKKREQLGIDPFSVPLNAPPPIVSEALYIKLLELIAQSRRENAHEIGFEIEELFGYLGIDPSRGRTPEEIEDELFDNRGLHPSEARSIADVLTRPKLGRPVTVRKTAVAALELRLHDPKTYSWWRIADLLCDRSECHLETHKGPEGELCWQRLRLAVIALQRFLKRNGIDPTFPLDCQDVEKSD